LLQIEELLASSTTKKALIRRFHRETVAGWLNPLTFLQNEGVELLSADGQVSILPYSEIRTVSFVRDFDLPEEHERDIFQTRPKMAGLWVRLRFRDGEAMEGILPNNLLQIELHGFVVVPPDPYGNRQRVFVPRAALIGVEVLGVVGSPLKKRKPKADSAEQIGLFDEPGA
jgi:hypothetical protein